jgi:hypothetical protein
MLEKIQTQDKRVVLVALLITAVVGILGASIVAKEISGYVASMTFFFVFFLAGVPIWILMAIVSVFYVVSDNQKIYGVALILSCVFLPISFVGSLKFMEAAKIARYKQGSDEMRPLGSELNDRIVVVLKETASTDNVQKLDENVLRKRIVQTNGVLLDFADGVCGITYPDTDFKFRIIGVGFCNNATEDEKKQIKNSVRSSPIVYKFFENVRMEDIPNLPIEKK